MLGQINMLHRIIVLAQLRSHFKDLLDAYLENPDRPKEDWKSFGKELSYDPEEFIVAIDLFMSGENMEPDEELIDKIASRY